MKDPSFWTNRNYPSRKTSQSLLPKVNVDCQKMRHQVRDNIAQYRKTRWKQFCLEEDMTFLLNLWLQVNIFLFNIIIKLFI